MQGKQKIACWCSDNALFYPVFVYHEPPKGEIKFQFSTTYQYYREVLRCAGCGHFVSVHTMDDTGLYTQDYVNANYQDIEGIHRTFERIISLPAEKSDNAGRVKRLVEFATSYLLPLSNMDQVPSVLDVGSGLGVFPYKIKDAGWNCTALDPDLRAVIHTRNVVGVNAIHADFMEAHDIGQYDIITFNKVLEHVEDPVAMLTKSVSHLHQKGFVYVEVPDGECAVVDGPEREEFFIDHLHVFSLASLALLANRAGFIVRSIERLQEPSTKYTLRAFLIQP